MFKIAITTTFLFLSMFVYCAQPGCPDTSAVIKPPKVFKPPKPGSFPYKGKPRRLDY